MASNDHIDETKTEVLKDNVSNSNNVHTSGDIGDVIVNTCIIVSSNLVEQANDDEDTHSENGRVLVENQIRDDRQYDKETEEKQNLIEKHVTEKEETVYRTDDKTSDNEIESTDLCVKDDQFGTESEKNNELVVIDDDTTNIKPRSRFSLYKDLYLFSFSYLFLFSAFNSFTSLQSTLYSTGSLGMIGMSILYIVFSAATLFATVYTTSRFKCMKLTMASMVTYTLYVCTGFYPTTATVISASILIGLGAANLWVVQHAYLTELARLFAAVTNRKIEDATNMFFGIYFGIYHTAQIWGNLVSSFVLKPDHSSNSTSDLEMCGVAYCPGSLNMTSIQPPSQHQIYVFISCCVGMCVVAMITVLFISDIKLPSTGSSTLSSLLKSVTSHIIQSRDQQLLLIPTIYRGLASGFILGDFTVAFVSCPLGVNYVGFTMMAYGVTSATSSLIFGKLVRYTGNIPLFILALMVHGAPALTMLLWKPDPDKPAVIFVLVSLWAVGHAAYILLTTSMYSTIFQGESAAPSYSTCRLLDSVGWAIALILSSWMCLRAKIIIIMINMTLSLITLIVLEKRQRAK